MKTPVLNAVSVKISKSNYAALRKLSKTTGPTISWLLNYAVSLYLQGLGEAKQKELQP